MLATLDQWAFKLLAILFIALGVQEKPPAQDLDWKINSLWSKSTNESYILELESDSISNYCKEHPRSYILFPKIYMGKQDILVDNYVVYSNGLSKDESISSMYERAFIECRILAQGKTVKFISHSYMKFFSSFSGYPKISETYPGGQYFYNSIYLVASALCICLAIIGSILMWNIERKTKIFYFVAQELFFSLFMYAYGGGAVLELSVVTQHSLVFLGFAGGFFLLVSIETKFLQNDKLKLLGVVGIFLMTAISLSYRNLIQIFIIMFISPFLFLFFLTTLNKWRQRDWAGVAMYCLVMGIGLKDSYVTLVSRDGVSHLSLLVIVVSTVNFVNVIKAVNKKKYEIRELNSKLESEKQSFERISRIYEAYREIVHDLKSPITAIQFAIGRESIPKESLVGIANRTSEILDRIGETGYKKVVDWYSVAFCFNQISDVCREKDGHQIKIDVNSSDPFHNLVELFLDPVDLKIIFAELLDNSEKASATTVNISASVNGSNFGIVYRDDGVGITKEQFEKFGQKGVSKTGTGLGIAGIKSKVESWGGKINLSRVEKGFCCEVVIKSRLMKANS